MIRWVDVIGGGGRAVQCMYSTYMYSMYILHTTYITCRSSSLVLTNQIVRSLINYYLHVLPPRPINISTLIIISTDRPPAALDQGISLTLSYYIQGGGGGGQFSPPFPGKIKLVRTTALDLGLLPPGGGHSV